jgi:hypothetical protein
MRHNKRLTAQPTSSIKPTERAQETKLKKLGIVEVAADPNEAKKQQLLLSYDGPHWDDAVGALSELFVVQTKAT